MKFDAQDIFALTVAVALHVLIAALLWFGAPSLFQKQAQIVPVKAVFLDTQRQNQAEQARLQAEAEAKRKAEEEAKRKAEEEAKRRAEEEARKKAEAEAKRKAEEEAKRKAQEEARIKAETEAKRKAEEEARKKAEAEAKRKKAEEEARKRRQQENERRMKEALAAEEAAIEAEREAAAQAKRDASDRDIYLSQLASHIERHWSRPPGVDDKFSCKIEIMQLPGGQIQNFKLTQSCGNSFLDASVEKAIRSADPLPLPKNRRVFERTLTLIFQP